MNKIKALAGQTALYGVSSILGRMLNFLLVPLHTEVFAEGQFGSISLLYAYVAVFNILYTYGMETAFFRFSTKDKKANYYHIAASAILITSLVISVAIFLLASPIASYLSLLHGESIVQWLAGIMLLDAIVALPFARLRLQNRALKFVVTRVSGIAITLALNFIFLVVLRDIAAGKYLPVANQLVSNFYSPSLEIGYVFLANLLGSLSVVLLLWRELLGIRLTFQWHAFKPMLLYGLPILLTGLAGMLNENLDKILLPAILPDSFYSHLSSMEALGVYSASFKLGIFMMLAIQAFRFAGEPFFFSNSADKNAPELFARVMRYFVIASAVIMVAISLNVELIARITLRNESYWQALYLVPIILLAKLLFGVYVNLSIWYKLTDKTLYGTYFTIVGTAVTILGNIILIPILGMAASAISAVLCYATMCLLAYGYGKRHFPIPYPLKIISAYILAACAIPAIFQFVEIQNKVLGYGVGLLVSLAFALVVFMIERKGLRESIVAVEE